MDRLIKKLPLVLIFLLLFSIAVTGCGGSNGEAEGDASKNEMLFFAVPDAPVIDWDPSICFSSETYLMANFYETLLRYDSANDVFIPVLATEYEKSDDGLIWTFKIRDDVYFHDGSKLDANAVVYSFDRSKNINKGASYIWDSVKSFSAPDDSTVVITLDYAAPVDLMVSCTYSAYIMSPELAKNGTDWFQQGNECGSGPYMLHSQSPGDEVIMTRYDNYWGGWEGDHFDTIVVKQVSENASRRQMIESGEADITFAIMTEDIKRLQENPDVTVYINDSFVNTLSFFNTQAPPFDNKLIRQALSYAFPYDDIVNYVYQGFITRPTGAIPTKMWGSLDKPLYEYDLEKARELLEKAGYPGGGFKIRLGYSTGTEDKKKTVELYKSELEKIGVEAELIAMPWDQLWERAKRPDPKERFDWLFFDCWPDVVSPSSWFKPFYMTEDEIILNLGYYSNPEFDEIIKEADIQSGIDRSVAEELYRQAGNIIAEDAVSIFVADKLYPYIIRNNLKNFSDDPAYPSTLFFYNFYRENE